ncbi:MAG: PAS domain S-box protein [Ferruginibacter sp.]
MIPADGENNEEKYSNTDLRDSERVYRNLVNGLPVAVYTCDAEGVIQLYNEALVKLWGFRPVIGKDMWWGLGKIFTGAGTPLPLDECPMAIALREGISVSFEIVFERPDGSRRIVLSNPQPILDAGGKVKGAINTLVDITPQVETLKTSEARFADDISESNARMKTILQYAPDAIVSIDEKGMIVNWNPEAETMFGWTENEVLGVELTDTIIPERYREQHRKGIQHFLRTGEGPAINRPLVLSALNKQLDEFPIELKVSATKVKDNYIFISFIRDIRVRKEAEETILNKTIQLEEAQQLAHIGSWEWDVKTNKVTWSDELYRIFGAVPQEFEATYESFLEYIHPDDREYVNGIVQKAFEDRQPFTFFHKICCSDESPGVISATGKVHTDMDGNIIKMTGTAQDVTAQKRYEKQLEESEERFTKIFDRNPIAMTLSEVGTNKIRYANDLFCSAFGYTREEVIGYSSEELNLMAPDEYNRVVAVILDSLKESRSISELQTLSPEESEELLLALRQSDVMKGFEVMYSRKNGETFPALVSFEVIRSGTNRFTVTSYFDISERKKSENLLKEQNIKLEKVNRELNSFAYISSHDLQEPLRKIQTFADLIRERDHEALSEKGKLYFERIQLAARRMRTLINDLLDYSRTTDRTTGFEQTDLNSVIDRVKEELKDELTEKNAQLDRNELGEALIIPFQFRQLMHNLVSNSLKFSKPGIPPRIMITGNRIQSGIQDQPFLGPGSYCHISVSDNGIGFDPEYKDRIFDIFQRLHGKEEFLGTGIGLAIVKKIVDNHNGFITAEGEEQKGAKFDIYLPL